MQKPYLWINNEGYHYDLFYISNNECLASTWVVQEGDGYKVHVDSPLKNAMRSCGLEDSFKINLIPQTILPKEYSLLGGHNLNKGILYLGLNGFIKTIKLEKDFFNNDKNKIYTNGGSEIFK